MNQPQRKVFPPTYLLLLLVVMIVLHIFIPISYWLDLPWRFAGLPLIIAAVALAVSGSQLFQRHGTTIRPFEESKALVTQGPYRFSRNPMYLSMLIVLIGVALMLGSLSALVVPPIFIWLITTRFIQKEEAMLERRFGDRYLNYKKRVRRWI